VIGRTK